MTAASEFGGCFLEACRRGRGRAGGVRLSLRGVTGTRSAVETDGHRSCSRVLHGFGTAPRAVTDLKDRMSGDISMVNASRSRLAGLMRFFHGAAARSSRRCLDWFCYREQFKGEGVDRRGLLAEHAASGRCESTRRDLFRELRMFMEYWEVQAA